MDKILLIKHIPEVLTDEAVQEFFLHYGAIDIKRMNKNGKMAYYIYFIF